MNTPKQSAAAEKAVNDILHRDLGPDQRKKVEQVLNGVGFQRKEGQQEPSPETATETETQGENVSPSLRKMVAEQNQMELDRQEERDTGSKAAPAAETETQGETNDYYNGVSL
jgi:hypothetical protein